MSYYAALAQALRDRRCTEAQVREALAAVSETTALSGSTPEDEFGPAKQYAESFTGTRRRTPAQLLRWLTLPAAILAVVVLRVFAFPHIDFLPWGALLSAVVFVAVWAMSEIVTTLVNRRLPQGFGLPPAA
ncbi:hypothetical protein F6B41_02090 [Microbacterium lushaniae]|nr:hypothetical protein F6B41_08060 [Microbacterium lushaniae]KAA9159258.1 hypothetical protein F6B41_02090 [Microbacterium lushaniae]